MTVDRYLAAACQLDRPNPADRAGIAAGVDHQLAVIERTVVGYRPFGDVRLVVFPEFSHAAPIYETVAEIHDRLTVPIPNEHTDRYRAAARAHGVHIQTGTFLECDQAFPGHVFNTTCLIGPDGLLTKYRKVNPWLPWELHTSPHDLPGYAEPLFPVADTEIGRLGAAICYDWLFPETIRQLALGGAEVLLRVSAYMDPWGATPPLDWWTVVNRCRALENIAYVVAANQAASASHYPPFSWPGGSMAVDFDGRILAQADPGPGEKVVVAPIDLAALRAARDRRSGHQMLAHLRSETAPLPPVFRQSVPGGVPTYAGNEQATAAARGRLEEEQRRRTVMTRSTGPRPGAREPQGSNTPAFIIAVIGAAASVCLLGWALLGWRPTAEKPAPSHHRSTAADGVVPSAATEALNRGVGLMEQFNFDAAAQEFARAREAAPDWLPARINHAIALLNTATDPNLDAARGELTAVLRDSPQEPHAHFCQGIIALHRNELDVARPHFEAVTKIDPEDASGWYHLGMSLAPGSDEATRCFEEARRLNPNLAAAMHGLAMNLRRSDPARSQQLLADQQALLDVEWDEPLRIRYAEMGRYGEVIAAGDRPRASRPAAATVLPKPVLPKFGPPMAIAGPQPAAAEPAAEADAETARLEAQLEVTFGATVVPVDVDGDDRTDLLVLTGGGLLLSMNRGGDESQPGPRFEDVTTASGLPATADGSIAAAVGDFDNDGRPDLAISRVRPVGAVSLFRNLGDGLFADVTEPAGLSVVAGPAAGMAWVDLDQDGDLDLVVARRDAAGGTAVLLNAGAAPLAEAGKPPPPLRPAFREQRIDGLSGVKADTIAVSDLDNDRDADLVLFSAGEPHVAWNDRLLRFRGGTLRERVASDAAIPPATSGLVLDADRDGWFDLFLLAAAEPPRLVSLRPATEGSDDAKPNLAAMPPLVQAAAADVDLDGAADIVGLSQAGAAVLLVNRGGRLESVADPFAPPSASGPADAAAPPAIGGDLLAALPADIDGDGQWDLVTQSRSRGLEWRRNLGNGNRSLRLLVSGRRERSASLRTNADGVAARVAALAGPTVASVENTTLSASLGQPRQPLVLGLGPSARADVVRIRWPDGVPQAELDLAAGKLVRIEETSRKTTSCPVLFAWDGAGYAFVTDFLGAGVTGEMLPDGTARVPRPHESVLVRPAPVPVAEPDGRSTVRLKIAEPFDEVLYLDGVSLFCIDHPVDCDAVPDERFPGSDPQPTGDTLLLGEPVFARRATDHAGRDVTAAIAAADAIYVGEFAARSWLGYAEEHFVDLDFGRGLAGYGPADRIVLELHGWTDYPYPESMLAAEQAGVRLLPPMLERLHADGTTDPLIEIGFPAGLPRVITREITGLVPGEDCRLRIRTSMQVGWDRIAVRPLIGSLPRGGVAAGAAPGPAEANASIASRSQPVRTRLPLTRATLAYRGMAREVVANDRGPVGYDDATRDRVPATRWQGDFTPAGDILDGVSADDASLTICGPGGEIECGFDAGGLPPLPAGWRRSFVLESHGYTRDTSPLTAGAGSVSPLPE